MAFIWTWSITPSLEVSCSILVRTRSGNTQVSDRCFKSNLYFLAPRYPQQVQSANGPTALSVSNGEEFADVEFLANTEVLPPNPRYLEVHAAFAKVLARSEAAVYIERVEKSNERGAPTNPNQEADFAMLLGFKLLSAAPWCLPCTCLKPPHLRWLFLCADEQMFLIPGSILTIVICNNFVPTNPCLFEGPALSTLSFPKLAAAYAWLFLIHKLSLLPADRASYSAYKRVRGKSRLFVFWRYHDNSFLRQTTRENLPGGCGRFAQLR